MKRILVRAMVLGAMGALAVAAGCVSGKPEADTMSLATVDTVKPATDTGMTAGSTTSPATVTDSTTRARQTAATSSKAGSTTKGRDSILGRDSAIQPNTTDPRFRLPVIDTTKRDTSKRPPE